MFLFHSADRCGRSAGCRSHVVRQWRGYIINDIVILHLLTPDQAYISERDMLTPSLKCPQELLSRTLMFTSQSCPNQLTTKCKRVVTVQSWMSWVDPSGLAPVAIMNCTQKGPGIHLQKVWTSTRSSK